MPLALKYLERGKWKTHERRKFVKSNSVKTAEELCGKRKVYERNVFSHLVELESGTNNRQGEGEGNACKAFIFKKQRSRGKTYLYERLNYRYSRKNNTLKERLSYLETGTERLT